MKAMGRNCRKMAFDDGPFPALRSISCIATLECALPRVARSSPTRAAPLVSDAGSLREVLVGDLQIMLPGDARRVAEPAANHMEGELSLELRLTGRS